MDGVALAGEVKKSAGSPRVVLLTGSGDIDRDEACLKNVDVVVEKPVTHADLREAIAKAMRKTQ
jgi:FixJ family two-component response regulator